jgi:HEPN domain-containing protein
MSSIEVLLNNFATRSFRETADNDYIAARLAFRAKLFPQFLWSSLQAIEKYLKCILILNRIPANRGHDLAKILKAFDNAKPFELRLTPQTRKFIVYLDTYGRNRYFESPYFIEGHELFSLDRAVWEIRRYARIMGYKAKNADGEEIDMLFHELATNLEAEKKHPQNFSILGGRLEEIISDKQHASRNALIWNNGYFGSSQRRSVRIPISLHFSNPPLMLNPQVLDEALKYVFLPKDVVEAYRNQTIKY